MKYENAISTEHLNCADSNQANPKFVLSIAH